MENHSGGKTRFTMAAIDHKETSSTTHKSGYKGKDHWSGSQVTLHLTLAVCLALANEMLTDSAGPRAKTGETRITEAMVS